MHTRIEPQIVALFREGYGRTAFLRDALAGVIVGIVALPLAIAFAIASGVKPEQGLATAIVAGFLISALSGSRVQIGGPTGAFVVIVYQIVQQHGYAGLAVATMIAGVLLILMGFARFGAVIKFIPYPITVGFTSGIALIIFAAQVRDLLGLPMTTPPADFVEKWIAYAAALPEANLRALGVAALAVAILVWWPRLSRRVPGPLVALLAATALVQLAGVRVETIGSRFGEVPNTLPRPGIPHLTWGMVTQLFGPGVTIALLAAIESLLSAVVADGMTGGRHRSNMELVAQGVANLVSPLFGGIPATGAIARTATNVKNGGRSPVAGMVHAATLLLVMLFFARWAALIPLAALAGILVVVSYNMSEWRLFVRLLRGQKSDIAVLLTTFLLTVFIDITVALEAGMVLASFLFMRRMAGVTQTRHVTRLLEEEEDGPDGNSVAARDIPPGVEVFEINGPFFFGAASSFKDAIGSVEKPPKVLILRVRHVLTMDGTALRALEDVVTRARRDGTQVILSDVHAQPMLLIEQTDLAELIGEANLTGDLDLALNRARDILGLPRAERKAAFAPTVSRDRVRLGAGYGAGGLAGGAEAFDEGKLPEG